MWSICHWVLILFNSTLKRKVEKLSSLHRPRTLHGSCTSFSLRTGFSEKLERPTENGILDPSFISALHMHIIEWSEESFLIFICISYFPQIAKIHAYMESQSYHKLRSDLQKSTSRRFQKWYQMELGSKPQTPSWSTVRHKTIMGIRPEAALFSLINFSATTKE